MPAPPLSRIVQEFGQVAVACRRKIPRAQLDRRYPLGHTGIEHPYYRFIIKTIANHTNLHTATLCIGMNIVHTCAQCPQIKNVVYVTAKLVKK
jgi:hypothetical protein